MLRHCCTHKMPDIKWSPNILADESRCSLLCTVTLVSILSQRKPWESLVSNPAFPATHTDAVNSAATCETVAEVSELPVDVLKAHGAGRGLSINCVIQLDT